MARSWIRNLIGLRGKQPSNDHEVREPPERAVVDVDTSIDADSDLDVDSDPTDSGLLEGDVTLDVDCALAAEPTEPSRRRERARGGSRNDKDARVDDDSGFAPDSGFDEAIADGDVSEAAAAVTPLPGAEPPAPTAVASDTLPTAAVDAPEPDDPVLGGTNCVDTIADFSPASRDARKDQIDLTHLQLSGFASLAVAANADGHAVVNLGDGNQIVLTDVTPDELTSDDFLF